jgi:hypothetical protein
MRRLELHTCSLVAAERAAAALVIAFFPNSLRHRLFFRFRLGLVNLPKYLEFCRASWAAECGLIADNLDLSVTSPAS